MKTIATAQPLIPHWMRGFLLIATAYNAAWGAFIIWYPNTFYQWVSASELDAPAIIQWQGRIVLLMAIAYLMGALYPRKFWYLVLIGALTKIIGATWFGMVILNGAPEKSGLFHLIMNDIIWIPFLAVIGYRFYKNKE